MTFECAEKYCTSLNAHLIEFSTQAQKDFLKQKIIAIHSTVWTNLKTGYVWWLNLGFRGEGKWYWNKSNTLCGFGNCWNLAGANNEYTAALHSNGDDVDDVKNSVLNYPICQTDCNPCPSKIFQS